MTIHTLTKSVQFNCDLSDREFAADYSICIYLIRMREYYRWVHGIPLNESLEQSALISWVSETEARWEEIEGCDYKEVEFEGRCYPPFEIERINKRLVPHGYTYQAGYGRFGKPVFLLAKLQSLEEYEQYKLIITGHELARELTAPPASLQKGQILIRSQAVSRLIWDLLEEWQWHRPDNAMAEVVKFYDFERQPLEALEKANADQQEVLILHELGELVAEGLVNPLWNEMLEEDNKHRHLFARAVRDNLADCVSTLPGLLAEDNIPAIHFYFASLTPTRKSMFPVLAKAYRVWRNNGSAQGLKQAIKQGQDHWLDIANRLTDEFSDGTQKHDVTVQTYIDQYAL
jgi:hypothetical protein